MNTWTKLDTFLGKRDARKVPSVRSTTIGRLQGGDIAVKYHYTIVVVAHQDGTFTLNSGNYRTSTTKARINEHSPARVYQKDFTWFLADGARFHDGVRVGADGLLLASV